MFEERNFMVQREQEQYEYISVLEKENDDCYKKIAKLEREIVELKEKIKQMYDDLDNTIYERNAAIAELNHVIGKLSKLELQNANNQDYLPRYNEKKLSKSKGTTNFGLDLKEKLESDKSKIHYSIRSKSL